MLVLPQEIQEAVSGWARTVPTQFGLEQFGI